MSKTLHPNNGRDALDHLTKSQLRKQLAEALEALKKDEAQLTAYQEQIQETQAEIGDLKELADKSHSAEKELGQARSSMEEISATSTKLRNEIDELKRANQTLQKDNEELKSRLHAAEEKASRQIEITKGEQREAERQRLKLEGKVRELEDRIQDLQKTAITLKEKLSIPTQPEEMTPEGISATKASFRIDLYPQEGDYQGKIEHLLSREKKAFKGLEQNNIMQFISSHLPRLAKQPERTEVRALAVTETPPVAVAKSSFDVRTLLSELNAVQPGVEVPTNFVTCKQEPFQVQMKVDFSNVSAADLPLVYKLTVYAKPLQSKAYEVIGETTSTITSAGGFPIKIRAKALPPGTYRLQADLTSKLMVGKVASYASFIEGGLVQIY